jgi:lycopene beta-cyclase
VMAVRMGAGSELPDPNPAVDRVTAGAGYRAVAEESGITPLISPAPGRRLGRRVMAIGLRGGRARPSTGYAVSRVLADSAAIAASLQGRGHPFDVPKDPWSQRALDAVWLRALAAERANLEPAFLALFSGVPVDSVWRLLDGTPTPGDLARIVRALPKWPFVRAACRTVGESGGS